MDIGNIFVAYGASQICPKQNILRAPNAFLTKIIVSGVTYGGGSYQNIDNSNLSSGSPLMM